MPDVADNAQDHIEREEAERLRVAQLVASDVPSRPDCVDCGEKIPEKRREAAKGCQRCIECATKKEQTL